MDQNQHQQQFQQQQHQSSHFDAIINQAIAPYLEMIEQLQNKEKEAEIVVLKYALLEMDRKFTELEKKTKTTGTGVARTGAGAASRTTGMAGKTGTGSSMTFQNILLINFYMTTPRGSSRATGATNARARSKTPTAGRMQNNLNTSVTSKTTAAGRDSNIGGKSTTRGDSKSRNTIKILFLKMIRVLTLKAIFSIQKLDNKLKLS